MVEWMGQNFDVFMSNEVTKTNLLVLVKVHGEQVSKIFPHKNTCTALERHRTFTDEKRLEAKTSALIC